MKTKIITLAFSLLTFLAFSMDLSAQEVRRPSSNTSSNIDVVKDLMTYLEKEITNNEDYKDYIGSDCSDNTCTTTGLTHTLFDEGVYLQDYEYFSFSIPQRYYDAFLEFVEKWKEEGNSAYTKDDGIIILSKNDKTVFDIYTNNKVILLTVFP